MREWRPTARAVRNWLSRTRAFRSAVYRLTPDMLALPSRAEEPDARLANISVPAEIVVYFHDTPDRLYQLAQWLPIFERVHESHPVLIVTRTLGAFRALTTTTSLPLLFLKRLLDLEEALERTDPKLCMYVNNAAGNFQVLSWRRALHVHLNHGESDKLSMSSNQAKAYDTVMVAGEAAERRYKDALLGFAGDNLIRVGRPQLDQRFECNLPQSALHTVLYAPTWEGETEGMNYTSVAEFGPSLVRDLLAAGTYRIVYKPHPRVVSGSGRVAAAHADIVGELKTAAKGAAPNDRHVVEERAPILSLFGVADGMITDVSSVAIDWLYLRNDAPLWICDPRDDRPGLYRQSPLAERTYVLDRTAMRGVAAHIAEVLAMDPRRAERQEARRLYFGDLEPGESTRRFLDAVDDLMHRRDALLSEKQASLLSAQTPIVAS